MLMHKDTDTQFPSESALAYSVFWGKLYLYSQLKNKFNSHSIYVIYDLVITIAGYLRPHQSDRQRIANLRIECYPHPLMHLIGG